MKSLVLGLVVAVALVGCGKEEQAASGGGDAAQQQQSGQSSGGGSPSAQPKTQYQAGGSCSEEFVEEVVSLVQGLTEALFQAMSDRDQSALRAAHGKAAGQCEAIVSKYGIDYSCTMPDGQVAEMTKLDTDCKKMRAGSM